MHFHMMVKHKVHVDHMKSQWLNQESIYYHCSMCKNQDLYKAAEYNRFSMFQVKSFSTDVSVIVMHSENLVFSGTWTHISHLHIVVWVINIKKWKKPSLDKIYLLEGYRGTEEDDKVLFGLFLYIYIGNMRETWASYGIKRWSIQFRVNILVQKLVVKLLGTY